MREELPPDDTGVLRPDEDTAVHEAVAPESVAPERAPLAPPAAAPRPWLPGPGPPGPPRGWLAVENPWPWLLLVLVPVAALLVWLLLLRGHGANQTVPRVVGLRQSAAVARLTRAGYDVTVVRAPSRRPLDVVFAQRPGAGSRLGKQQSVTIDVANGSKPVARPKPAPLPTTATTATTAASVTVPQVAAEVQADAGGAVEAAGLVPDSYPVRSSEPPGTVVAQSPAAGTPLATGGTVRLNVSSGTNAQPSASVPDVSGQTAADARAALWNAKLTVRTVYAHAPSAAQIGHVLGETGAGSTLPAFSQVTITVGR